MPDITKLQNLDAGIIPRRAFPLHKWYYANPLWYYHAPATQHRLYTDAKFFELVDPLLRELCHILLDAGLHTTPSCQGHFYSQERFERVWEELLQEARLIRDEGLVVKDSETDQAYRFHQSEYQLPWKEFSEFYHQAQRQQTHGYLGIAIPTEKLELVSRFHKLSLPSPRSRIEIDPELSTIFRRPAFSILTEPTTREERKAIWEQITREIEVLVNR